MGSPFWKCPQCHETTRKNDQMFQMVEISGPNTMFAVPAARCPDCSARLDFHEVYIEGKYDVPIEEVYSGKHGADLVEGIRRFHAAGKIQLSNEEKRLLEQGVAEKDSSVTPVQDAKSNMCAKCSEYAAGAEFTFHYGRAGRVEGNRNVFICTRCQDRFYRSKWFMQFGLLAAVFACILSMTMFFIFGEGSTGREVGVVVGLSTVFLPVVLILASPFYRTSFVLQPRFGFTLFEKSGRIMTHLDRNEALECFAMRLDDPGREYRLFLSRFGEPQVDPQKTARKVADESEHLLKAFSEMDNRGTRHDTQSIARAYWMARMISHPKDPFVLYDFDAERDACEALLELPCIHVATDSGKLICTEALIFGYYATEEGTYRAVICGNDLTHELWEQARTSFIKHGGRPKGEGEQEPEKRTTPVQTAKSSQPSEVVFVREDRQVKMGMTYTYRIYKGADAASAKAFLARNPVTKPLFYVVVETPEGNYCRDIDGTFKE